MMIGLYILILYNKIMIFGCMFYIYYLGLNIYLREMVNLVIFVSYLFLIKKKIVMDIFILFYI